MELVVNFFQLGMSVSAYGSIRVPRVGSTNRALLELAKPLACIAHPPRRMSDAGSTEDSVGFAKRFLCLFFKRNLLQRVWIQTLEYSLINRRAASVYEVSSPQCARCCDSRVVFAG